jgi:hypothetical protein
MKRFVSKMEIVGLETMIATQFRDCMQLCRPDI